MLLRSSSTSASSSSAPSKSRRPHPYKSLLRYARSMDDASSIAPPPSLSPWNVSHVCLALLTALATATISILCSASSPPPSQPASLAVPNRRSSVGRAVSMPQALHSLQHAARSRALEHNKADSSAACRLVDELRARHVWVQHVLASGANTSGSASPRLVGGNDVEIELREELRKFGEELKEFFLGGDESDSCFVYDRALCGYVPELKRLEKVCARFSTWGEGLRRRVGVGGGRGEEVKSRSSRSF